MKKGTDRSENCMIVAEAHAGKASPELCVDLLGCATSHKQESGQDKLKKQLTEAGLRAVNQYRNAVLLSGLCG
jgi:hypothetical protein